MKSIRIICAIALLPGLVLADPIVTITNSAEREVVVTEADGTQVITMERVTNASPNDVVVYTLTYENSGDAAASDVVINDPIPSDVAYRMGSAFGAGTDIVGSVDGGLSWGPLDELTVTEADGTTRAATGEDVTHLRWMLRNPLPPGGRGFVRFKVVVQ